MGLVVFLGMSMVCFVKDRELLFIVTGHYRLLGMWSMPRVVVLIYWGIL